MHFLLIAALVMKLTTDLPGHSSRGYCMGAAGSARAFAFNRKIVKHVTGLAGEKLDLMAVVACVMANSGYAAFEIEAKNNAPADGAPEGSPNTRNSHRHGSSTKEDQ